MEEASKAKDKAKFPPGDVRNLALFRKFEDFIIYFEPIVEKFPHYEHFALETDIKNCLHRTMELIIKTNRSSRKLEGWYHIDTEFEVIRFYIRFAYAKGSKYLSSHSYETASKKMKELGCILGGLIKNR